MRHAVGQHCATFDKSHMPMRRIFWTALALFQVTPALSQDLSEPLSNVLPRSAAEQARVASILQAPAQFDRLQPFETLPAGAATVRYRADRTVFRHPSETIGAQALDFTLGQAMFEKLWVSSPSSTKASDGLGPLFNARSCRACHLGNSRGHAPDGPEDDAQSMVLRLIRPDGSGDPVYGGQFQDFSTSGVAAEGRVRVDWQDAPVSLSGGENVMLRQPSLSVTNLAYGPLDPETGLSARVAQQMIGLGLLEAIPTADILALADPDDRDGDGISGRARRVTLPGTEEKQLGRFGYKAAMPTVRAQSAAAAHGDIGLSSPIFPAAAGDCSLAQTACQEAPHGDGDVREHEVDDTGLDLITLYSRNIGVPERRTPEDPAVLNGKRVFHQIGCAACHQPNFVTHRLQDQPAQSFQLIWPYTDMLLHDMGPGLADAGPLGAEWRTPPLWGIGLTAQAVGHSQFLHDGRARSLTEAILWHGGEGQAARDSFAAQPAPDRADLIRFLESL
jgi:CxxC motif-containing protein (DUF1111 family)